MDTNNLGEIIAPNIDMTPIEQAKESRKNALSSQLNPEAAAQLEKDMDLFEFQAEGFGNEVKGIMKQKNTYLIDYLKSHDVPVSGGDGGVAHNTDGSTYISEVPLQLQGTSLPYYMLPELDVVIDMQNVFKIMFPDGARAGARTSQKQMGEAVKPEYAKRIGGIFQ